MAGKFSAYPVFPVILNRFGGATAFLIFDIMCVILLLFTIFKVPETRGKSLEELEKILVKKALRLILNSQEHLINFRNFIDLSVSKLNDKSF